MAWFVLILSGVLEAVWATALGASDGLTEPVATTVFLVSVVLSMIGLAWAMKFLPISVAYAVWTGIGAGLAVLYAMVWGAESATLPRIIFLTGIIAAIAGLKVTATPASAEEPAALRPAALSANALRPTALIPAALRPTAQPLPGQSTLGVAEHSGGGAAQ